MGYTRAAWDRTLHLVRSGRLPVRRAVTSRILRADVMERGFGTLTSPSQDELKILILVMQQEA